MYHTSLILAHQFQNSPFWWVLVLAMPAAVSRASICNKIQILLIPSLRWHYPTSTLLRISLTSLRRIRLVLKLSFLISSFDIIIYSLRISQVPTFTVSTCHALRLRMAKSTVWSGVAFASWNSLGHITSQLSLEALSLKGAISPNGLQTLCLHFTCFVT